MKIMYFTGGLGNQMFEYAFYLYMRKLLPKEKFYGLYNKKKLGEHYGLEINKWFDVEIPSSTLYSDIVAYSIYVMRNFLKIDRWYDADRTVLSKPQAIMFNAFKYNKEYFPTGNEWLKFKIDEESLSDQNKQVLLDIRNNQSVFVHVRRGDYLSPKFLKTFEGICTMEYYKRAMDIVKKKFDNPKFYVFSDDIDWCKENLEIEAPTFITWNTGEQSPLDMFLMSQCKGAIIANSTFSYWGAYLGIADKIVVYPKKWINGQETPNIFMNEWKEI